ncbi:MAG: hypothetical protein ACRDP6_13980 [Actinoallomurus sp.]
MAGDDQHDRHELGVVEERVAWSARAALLDDRLSRAENYGSLVLILTIVGLMVFKP